MEKVRELTIDGAGPYRVSNVRGILDPGKFEGEWPHAVRDYASEYHADSFGNSTEWVGFYWEANGRYYREDSQGFVSELTFEQYKTDEEAWFLDSARESEREEALDDARNALEEAQAEDRGTCAQCEALMINGTRCHETGCPVPANIERLRARVEAIEEA